MELIGKVASFAGYGTDAMNICLAVGPKQTRVVRHACLRRNIGYLDFLLAKSFERNASAIATSTTFAMGEFMNSRVLPWLEVNQADWKELCTAHNLEECKEVTKVSPTKGMVGVLGNPIAMLFNPSVAIEFGLVEVLKYLVEEVGIDINSCQWNAYQSLEMKHLLAYASEMSDGSWFGYLLSRNDINVHARYVAASEQDRANDDDSDEEVDDSKQRSVFEYIYDSENISLRAFESIIRHSSFKPNEPMDLIGAIVMRPLQYACMSISADLEESDPDRKFEKLLSLIKKTDVDPTLRTEEVPDPYSLTYESTH